MILHTRFPKDFRNTLIGGMSPQLSAKAQATLGRWLNLRQNLVGDRHESSC
jgi:hypothetical protein